MKPFADGKLIIVCGLPGSGKTTHAVAVADQLNAIRLNPDDWMEALAFNLHDEALRSKVEALQWKLAQDLLARGLTVIIEWGTWGREERDVLRLGARTLSAAVELHYLTAPIDVLYQRIRTRAAESPPIEMEDLIRWARIFQEPTPEEMALFDAAFRIDSGPPDRAQENR